MRIAGKPRPTKTIDIPDDPSKKTATAAYAKRDGRGSSGGPLSRRRRTTHPRKLPSASEPNLTSEYPVA